MARWLLAGGSCVMFMGLGMTVPLAAAYAESRPTTGVSLGLLLAGGLLFPCGLAATVVGLFRRDGNAMPSGVRAAVMANVLFLAFCALEFSDGLVRQNGRIFYWTTIAFWPALLVFYGLVSARSWAWWTTRGLTALVCLLFLVFVAVIPFGDIRGAHGVPAPWYARVYMIGVTLVFAGIAAGAYRSLGGAEARSYFRLVRTRIAAGNADATG